VSIRLSRWIALALVLSATPLVNAERLPPAPAAYFNDYAGVVPPSAGQTLNARLQQFERDTSNQLVVAIFPRMESSSSIEDYTVRVAQSWKVGQQGKNNGAVLFVFVASHQLYIQVGYGLEGSLPDATCKAIIDNEIKPRFRAGDYGGGLDAAITAMIAATKGEYKGTGRTQADNRSGSSFLDAVSALIIPFIILIILIRMLGGMTNRDRTYGRSSSTNWWTDSGGGGGFGGGSSGSGGGGFSGGGGSFGGGGSGGSW
jgi:uncharacterized protein